MTTPESWFFLLRHYIYHYQGGGKKNQGNYLQDCAKFTFKGMKRIRISICSCRIQVRSLTFVNQHTCINKIRTFFFPIGKGNQAYANIWLSWNQRNANEQMRNANDSNI